MVPLFDATATYWNWPPVTTTTAGYYWGANTVLAIAASPRVRTPPPSRSGPTPYQRAAPAPALVLTARTPGRRARLEARPSRALRQRRRRARA